MIIFSIFIQLLIHSFIDKCIDVEFEDASFALTDLIQGYGYFCHSNEDEEKDYL